MCFIWLFFGWMDVIGLPSKPTITTANHVFSIFIFLLVVCFDSSYFLYIRETRSFVCRVPNRNSSYNSAARLRERKTAIIAIYHVNYLLRPSVCLYVLFFSVTNYEFNITSTTKPLVVIVPTTHLLHYSTCLFVFCLSHAVFLPSSSFVRSATSTNQPTTTVSCFLFLLLYGF